MSHEEENGHAFVREAEFRVLEQRVEEWERIMNQRSGDLEHRQITRDAEIRRDVAQIRSDIGNLRAELQVNHERLVDLLAPSKKRKKKK